MELSIHTIAKEYIYTRVLLNLVGKLGLDLLVFIRVLEIVDWTIHMRCYATLRYAGFERHLASSVHLSTMRLSSCKASFPVLSGTSYAASIISLKQLVLHRFPHQLHYHLHLRYHS